MKKKDLTFFLALLVIIIFFFSAMHNIDNVFNMVRLEQSQLQDSSLVVNNINMVTLYKWSYYIIFMTYFFTTIISMSLYYRYACMKRKLEGDFLE